MVAQAGDIVRVHYTGTLDNGATFDSSTERDPLEFTLGGGQVIAGFEQAIEGMEVGQSQVVTIPADNAYGPHRGELVQTVAREQIPAHLELEPGKRLEAQDANGGRQLLTIVSADDAKVVLDANHPLAGQDLTFDLQLVEIVKAA